MSDNWFYIQQWKRNKFSRIGLEMNSYEAKELFDDISGYNGIEYLALISVGSKWKVVASKDDVKDWNIIKLNSKQKA